MILRPLCKKPLRRFEGVFKIPNLLFQLLAGNKRRQKKKRGKGTKTSQKPLKYPSCEKTRRGRERGKPSFVPTHPDFRRQATASQFHIVSNGLSMLGG